MKTKTKRNVKKYIQSKPYGITITQILEKYNISRRIISNYLMRESQKGELISRGIGRYKLYYGVKSRYAKDLVKYKNGDVVISHNDERQNVS